MLDRQNVAFPAAAYFIHTVAAPQTPSRLLSSSAHRGCLHKDGDGRDWVTDDATRRRGRRSSPAANRSMSVFVTTRERGRGRGEPRDRKREERGRDLRGPPSSKALTRSMSCPLFTSRSLDPSRLYLILCGVRNATMAGRANEGSILWTGDGVNEGIEVATPIILSYIVYALLSVISQ